MTAGSLKAETMMEILLLTSMRFPTVLKLLPSTFTVKVKSGFARDIDSTSVKSNPVFSVLGLYFGLYSSAGYQTCAGNCYHLFLLIIIKNAFQPSPALLLPKLTFFLGGVLYLPGTCLGRMASLGHEESDARNYANWSVDYLKVTSTLVI
jgi:hypothetical protein